VEYEIVRTGPKPVVMVKDIKTHRTN